MNQIKSQKEKGKRDLTALAIHKIDPREALQLLWEKGDEEGFVCIPRSLWDKMQWIERRLPKNLCVNFCDYNWLAGIYNEILHQIGDMVKIAYLPPVNGKPSDTAFIVIHDRFYPLLRLIRIVELYEAEDEAESQV